jgi:hypothetical protein
MVMGVEPGLKQCWSFFQGQLPLKEVQEHIIMTIAPSEARAQLLLSNPAMREFKIDGLRVLTASTHGVLRWVRPNFPPLKAAISCRISRDHA